MALASGSVAGADLSLAWLEAARQLERIPGRKAAHQVVRIVDPTAEDPAVRAELDRVLASRGWQSTGTVANTIFPHALADRYPEPADLAHHYRDVLLPRIRRLSREKNRGGTYFGRLVAYPGANGGPVDQLSATVAKLRRERSLPGPLSSCYEAAVHSPVDDLPDSDGDSDGPAQGRPALTYSCSDITTRMGFPCLSLVSFHLDGALLHLTAHYRNQMLVERGYGNYLGLGRLLAYVARAARCEPGELLVVAGHVELERVPALRGLLDGHQPLEFATS